MSEATARATTRQLRRAMGAEAIGVVNNHAAELQAIHVRLGELLAQATEQGRMLQAQQAKVISLAQMQGVTFNSLAEFCGRALRARLRWIVTGR